MPAVCLHQILFAQAELKRLDAGEKPRTSLTRDQLQDLANTPWQGLPTQKKKLPKAR